MDDARYVMTLVRTAARYGAHVGVPDPGHRLPARRRAGHRRPRRGPGVRAGAGDPRPAGGQRHRACGPTRSRPWSAAAASSTSARPRACTWSCRGTGSSPRTGIILRTPFSVLFVIPWGRHWIIGTTDTDWSLDKAHPAASRTDIDYVLGQVNRVLAVPLTRDDVEGVYAGLRPLLAGESDSTSKLSREHIVAHPVPGLVMIAGGKYTTYRLMARDAVDAVGARAGLAGAAVLHRRRAAGRRGRLRRRCGTPRYRLARSSRPARGPDRAPAAPVRVAGRRGPRPDRGRARTWAGRSPAPTTTCAPRSCYAASHEGARHLDDVLARRTHISIETWDRGLSAAAEAAELMAGPMRWTTARWPREVEHYQAPVAAERASQDASTDQDADAIRLGRPGHRAGCQLTRSGAGRLTRGDGRPRCSPPAGQGCGLARN